MGHLSLSSALRRSEGYDCSGLNSVLAVTALSALVLSMFPSIDLLVARQFYSGSGQ